MPISREHILEEIKRTALANGGTPLGLRVFERVTGVKVSDWRGRYWARWGDALAEAGLSPNTLNEAISDEILLGHLFDLTLALGKFPTSSEMQLRRRTNQTFPSYDAFARRWQKAEMPVAVAAFCDDSDEGKQVREICLAEASRNNAPSEAAARTDESGFGWVYLMKSGRYYKIGRSASTGRRQYEVALQMPDPVVVIHEIKTDDPVGIEAYWHSRFAHLRRNGEWFDLSAEDIAAFRRRKNFM